MKKQFGLIGFPLGHSFSKRYFTEKFLREGISDTHSYETYELPDASLLPDLLVKHPDLIGLNVTIPHKQAVMPFLSELDPLAKRIGAVNVIKIMPDGSLKGYNSDYYGFRDSLLAWEAYQEKQPKSALILGDGGATRAVRVVLEDLEISYQTVSRKENSGFLSYENLTKKIIQEHTLIINTTPLGTYPNVDTLPPIPYEFLTPEHLLYDLVYNPGTTRFMDEGLTKGASSHNGYAMLVGQAEKAFQIWNK